MTAIANTFQTFQAKGIRESLSDVISRVSMEKRPFISNIGKESAGGNNFYEWQVDNLAAVDLTNARIEGDDKTSFDAVTPTVRLGNYTQIMDKTAIVSDRMEKVKKAGRKSEMAYQIAKKGAELMNDREAIFLSNQGALAGTTSTAGKTGSLLAFIKTNTSIGAGGVNPVYTNIPTDVRTDGTQRAFTEALLKDAHQKAWAQGGSPDMLMVGPINKQRASGFSGIAQLRTETNKKVATIVGAADIYVGDFGQISIVPNAFQRERDALLIDTEYASVAELQSFEIIELAKTGAAEKRLLQMDTGLKILNEKAHAGIFDLTTT